MSLTKTLYIVIIMHTILENKKIKIATGNYKLKIKTSEQEISKKSQREFLEIENVIIKTKNSMIKFHGRLDTEGEKCGRRKISQKYFQNVVHRKREENT